MRRILAILVVGLLLVACESRRDVGAAKPSVVKAEPKPQERAGEPIVRVRVRREAQTLRFTGPAKLRIYPADQPLHKQHLSTPLTISRSGGQWIGKFSGPGMPSKSIIVVEPVGPVPLAIEGQSFPGEMRLVPRNLIPDTTPDFDHFDLVNHVRLEEYLPGVLDRELYDHWEPATYMAQAIAARSYAIDRVMNDGPGRHFDMENTQSSQAYGGKTGHTLALRAVAETVGLILTYNQRVLPAYYSSTCGGANQSARDAFDVPNLPPLVPQRACTWCEGARHCKWGTVTRDRVDLSRRIAAWGRKEGNLLAALGKIVAMGASKSNSVGRPTEFFITDDKGKKYLLTAESFRHACNFSPLSLGERAGVRAEQSLPVLPDSDRLRSSAFEVQTTGEKVRFTNGRGFGHCVGLCQYGAQAMAKAGNTPPQILAYYYPTATIERAY